MRNQGGFSSIRAVLHRHFSFHRHGNVHPCQSSALQEFETRLTERLEELKLSGESKGFLSLDLLLHAMSVILATHSNVERLIPESQLSLSQQVDNSWVDEYFDDSAKLLDVCNVLKEGITEVENYQMLVQLALHNLESSIESGNDGRYVRAKNALTEFEEAMKKKEAMLEKEAESNQDVPKSKLEKCSSMLRTMGEKLLSPKGPEAVKANGFLNAVYGFKLEELHNVDASVRGLHEFLNGHLTDNNFLITQEEIAEMKVMLEELRKHSSDLGIGLVPLEIQVNELFRMLISSRLALLDTISNSKTCGPYLMLSYENVYRSSVHA
uniref:Uncharacterized protein n=1 Tax=Physcomitrium patens TaxID=3218 RepID=A0A7I4FNX6_PHYPA